MSVEKKLMEDMKEAMKQKDNLRLSVIRYTRSAIQRYKIDNIKKELTEQELENILTSEAKKREDSIRTFKEAEREDLVEKEQKELEILSKYLPEQINPDKLRILIKEKLAEHNFKGKKDFGLAMKVIIPAFRSQAPGNLIKEIVSDELGN